METSKFRNCLNRKILKKIFFWRTQLFKNFLLFFCLHSRKEPTIVFFYSRSFWVIPNWPPSPLVSLNRNAFWKFFPIKDFFFSTGEIKNQLTALSLCFGGKWPEGGRELAGITWWLEFCFNWSLSFPCK